MLLRLCCASVVLLLLRCCGSAGLAAVSAAVAARADRCWSLRLLHGVLIMLLLTAGVTPRSRASMPALVIPIAFIFVVSRRRCRVQAEAWAGGFQNCSVLPQSFLVLRIGRAADGFAGYDKFDSPVLLPAGSVIVRGYRQRVAETLGGDRIRRHSLVAPGSRAPNRRGSQTGSDSSGRRRHCPCSRPLRC